MSVWILTLIIICSQIVARGQAPDWITVAEDTRVLVLDPAGDLVRVAGVALSFERPTKVLVEVRFDSREADSKSTTAPPKDPNRIARVTIYKWGPLGKNTDCTKKPCWTQLQQISDYQANRSSYSLRVTAGDRWVVSAFDPSAGLTRGGKPAQLRRVRYSDDPEGKPGTIIFRGSRVNMTIRPAADK